MKEDPFHPKCLPVHVALLVELNKTNALFHLAHRFEILVWKTQNTERKFFTF
jgi:hypothetical protein